MQSRPFIVAEMSANHLGSLNRALQICDVAIQAGADAVKLQVWSPDLMVGNKSVMVESGPWEGRRMFDLYQDAFMPWEWVETLMLHCESLGIECFATAFDLPALAFLESLDVPRHKISSFEIVDLELVGAAAATGKPLILSTGMADEFDINRALDAVGRQAPVTLLHCVSAYPCQPEQANLRRMQALKEQFIVDVGLSDHSLGGGVAAAAATLGASMIEKHLTLSREDGGPDAGFSLEPDEFAAMAEACRDAWKSVWFTGATLDTEQQNRHFRRSLWFARDCPAGHTLTRDDIQCSRPGYGIPPRALPGVIGAKLVRPAVVGFPVTWEDLGHLLAEA